MFICINVGIFLQLFDKVYHDEKNHQLKKKSIYNCKRHFSIKSH